MKLDLSVIVFVCGVGGGIGDFGFPLHRAIFSDSYKKVHSTFFICVRPLIDFLAS